MPQDSAITHAVKLNINFPLRLLLPPLYGAFCLLGVIRVNNNSFAVKDAWTHLAIIVPLAYLAAGLPSLGFAFLMKRYGRRRPSHGERLMRAALLGFAAGVFVSLLSAIGDVHLWNAVYIPIGSIVGILVEATVMGLGACLRKTAAENPRPHRVDRPRSV